MDCTIKELQATLLDMLKDFDVFCQNHDIQYSLCGGNVIGAVRHKGFIPWDDDIDVFLTRENYEKFLNTFENSEKYTLQKDNDDYPLQFSKLRLNNSTFIEDIPYKGKYKKIHQGVFIDIFPVDKISNNKIKTKLQVIASNLVLTQSLFLRGYKTHSVSKKLVIYVSILLLPLEKLLIKYVKSCNKMTNNFKYCSFYDSVKKSFFEISDFDNIKERLPYEDSAFPVMNNYKQYLTNYYGDYMKLPSPEEQKAHIHAKYVNLKEDYTKFI